VGASSANVVAPGIRVKVFPWRQGDWVLDGWMAGGVLTLPGKSTTQVQTGSPRRRQAAAGAARTGQTMRMWIKGGEGVEASFEEAQS
jgi:hypothetical protein